MMKTQILFLFFALLSITVISAQQSMVSGAVTSIEGFEINGAQIKLWEETPAPNPDILLKETITGENGVYWFIVGWYGVTKPLYITVHYQGKKVFISEVYRDFTPSAYRVLTINAQINLIPNHEFKRNDDDRDGIPDDYEDYLAHKFAPLVHLHPEDWALPANVDWFLNRSIVKYKHYEKFFDNKSHNVFQNNDSANPLTQSKLISLKHWPMKFTGNPFDPYDHDRNQSIFSRTTDRFYLQLKDESYRKGTTDKDLWKVYFHVRSSSHLKEAYDIQYWFFYPFNPGPDNSTGLDDHEGEWEHITVTVNTKLNIHSIFFAQHGGGERFLKGQFDVTSDGHPIVFSAKGSHASYPIEGNFSTDWAPDPVDASFYASLATAVNLPFINLFFIAPFVQFTDEFIALDETRASSPDRQWRTWEKENLINIGEISHPLNGQLFTKFAGRWGKDSTSPVGPLFKKTWSKDEFWNPDHLVLNTNESLKNEEVKIWASETITMEKFQVNNTGKLLLQTKDKIDLKPGFIVKEGGSFKTALEAFTF